MEFYHFKRLLDYSDLNEEASFKKLNMFLGRDPYPNIQEGRTLQCSAQLDCFTLFEHRFEASLNLIYQIKDKKRAIEVGSIGNSKVAVEEIVIKFIEKVLSPIMADYCWIYDLNHNLSHPILYKIKRGKTKEDISLEQSNYFSDVMEKVNEEARKHHWHGCFVNHASLLPLKREYWINKQGEFMTSEELKLVRSKYGDKLIGELVVLQVEAARQRMIRESQSGSFKPGENTEIEYLVEGGNLQFRWKDQAKGRIQLFRHAEKGYPTNPQQGTMIVDSNYKGGKEIDFDIPKGRPIYYSAVRQWEDQDGVQTRTLCRFSVFVPEEEQEESAFSEYEKKLKDEEDKIKFNNEVRLLKAKSKLDQIKRIQEMREEEKKREEKRFLNLNKSRNISELPKDVSLRLNVILEEIDDMFNKMESEIRREARV